MQKTNKINKGSKCGLLAVAKPLLAMVLLYHESLIRPLNFCEVFFSGFHFKCGFQTLLVRKRGLVRVNDTIQSS